MRKIAVIIGMLWALALPAIQEECSVCGRIIGAGQYYRFGDGQIACSKNCLKKLLPVCAACGRTIEGKYYRDAQERMYCSETCINTTLPKCSVCGRPFAVGAQMGDGSVRCNDCMKLPVCSSCRNPIRSVAETLSDGRKICPECRQGGIFSIGEARREFNLVRRQLNTLFGLHVSGKVELHLVGLEELQRITNEGDGERGVCRHEVITTTRGKRIVRNEHKRDIYILDGLRPEYFRAVAAHELAHDWFNMTIEGELPVPVMEGWAELVSWSYCREMGYGEQQKLIEGNGVDLYREGFLQMKSKLTLPEKPQKIKALFMSMHPTRHVWSKKR